MYFFLLLDKNNLFILVYFADLLILNPVDFGGGFFFPVIDSKHDAHLLQRDKLWILIWQT